MRTILSVIFLCLPLSAFAQDYRLYLKVCSSYSDGQFRNCPKQGPLSTEVSFDRIYAYIELDWLTDEANRPTQTLYIRWEFHGTDGTIVPLSNPDTNEDYIWGPLTYNDPTHWTVSQRVWPEKAGAYKIYVYSDLSNPDDFLAEGMVEVR